MIQKVLEKIRTVFDDEDFKKNATQDLQLVVVTVIGITLLLLFISVRGSDNDSQIGNSHSPSKNDERGMR